jgi:hypothetical protein
MISIPLRNRKGEIVAYAVVDDGDAALVEYDWHLSSHGYPSRGERTANGKLLIVRMHREVMGLRPGDGLKVDHKDRNKLDNRRSNLRIASAAANAQNTSGWRSSTSPYRGVCWVPSRGKWLAQAMVDYKQNFLGYFDSEEKAAEAARAFRSQRMPFSIESDSVAA